jgi:hypothetical protein
LEHPSTICERKTFEFLTPDLYEFAQLVRTALLSAIEACSLSVNPESETTRDKGSQAIHVWAMTLGPLIWDVSGSVLLLLSHGERRAPVILNRSVFEYQMRMRYYVLRPDKAVEAIQQLPERFRKIMRADTSWKNGRGAVSIAETEAFLDEHVKLNRENIKQDVFKTVFGEQADALYDGYYGKASALVHGHETLMRDVHSEYYNGVENPQVDFTGAVWTPDDAAAVLVHNLLDGLEVLTTISGETDGCAELDKGFADLQVRLGIST